MPNVHTGKLGPLMATEEALAALPVADLPDGVHSRIHTRHDTVTDHTWQRVQVWPDGTDPDTRPSFGAGVVAEIEWDDARGGYLVYVSGRSHGAYVQAAGHVVTYDAAGAVQRAAMEVAWELKRQQRGW